MKNMISLSNYFYSNLRQKEMEAKDNQLKMSRKPNGEKSSDDAKLSENKNSEAVKPGKREGTSKPSETKPVAKKIKGSDYAAWDKFNVEEDLVIFVASTSSRFLFVSFTSNVVIVVVLISPYRRRFNLIYFDAIFVFWLQDDDDEGSEGSEEDSEDEEQFLIQQAIVEKDKGNDFFKVKGYQW